MTFIIIMVEYLMFNLKLLFATITFFIILIYFERGLSLFNIINAYFWNKKLNNFHFFFLGKTLSPCSSTSFQTIQFRELNIKSEYLEPNIELSPEKLVNTISGIYYILTFVGHFWYTFTISFISNVVMES